MDFSNVKYIRIPEGYATKVILDDTIVWEESAPMLASSNTWYKGTPAHNTYTSIEITRDYTPTNSEDETWNADSENAGTIKAYRSGTNLILAITNGARFIYANPNSSLAFGGNSSATRWSHVTSFTGLELLNTSKVTTMERMFDGLFLLENIDVSHFDTSLVTNMDMVFNNCEELKEIDVSKWDTSNVTDMYAMFADCTQITKLDISRWDVRKVSNANSLVYDCFKLKDIDLSSADWCGVTNFGMSFYCCYELENISLKRSGKAHSESAVVLQAVVSDCTKLKSFDSANFSTQGATDLSYFFEGCSTLEEVRLTNWDFSTSTSHYSMFAACNKLKRVDLHGVVQSIKAAPRNIFPYNTSQKIEVYVGSEEEKNFVQNNLALNATNLIFYIGDMPFK